MTKRTNEQSTTSQKCGAVLNGQTITFTLRRSARARRLRLEVRPETGLTAVLPRRYDMRQLEKFLDAKADWVLAKLADISRLRPSEGAGGLKSGDCVPFLGKDLKVVVQSSWDAPCVKLKGDRLLVTVSDGADGLAPMLEQWYRARAAELLNRRTAELSAKLGLSYKRLMIRGQRTRWGSCSHSCNLSFNWRLVMAPRPVVDYVVLHELAHLKEMNHTKRFWKLLAEYCPQWRQHRRWLKDHGPGLAAVLAA